MLAIVASQHLQPWTTIHASCQEHYKSGPALLSCCTLAFMRAVVHFKKMLVCEAMPLELLTFPSELPSPIQRAPLKQIPRKHGTYHYHRRRHRHE